MEGGGEESKGDRGAIHVYLYVSISIFLNVRRLWVRAIFNWITVLEKVYSSYGSLNICFFLKNNFLRTRASDFSKIKNSLSLVSIQLGTKTTFFFTIRLYLPKMGRA